MLLRNKGAKFRSWLRSESDFDRNAVVAYLGELARESGWSKNVRSVLSITGAFGGAALGAHLGDSATGSALGAALAGEAVRFVSDLAAKVDQGWQPKVFGETAQDIVEAARRERRAGSQGA